VPAAEEREDRVVQGRLAPAWRDCESTETVLAPRDVDRGFELIAAESVELLGKPEIGRGKAQASCPSCGNRGSTALNLKQRLRK